MMELRDGSKKSVIMEFKGHNQRKGNVKSWKCLRQYLRGTLCSKLFNIC